MRSLVRSASFLMVVLFVYAAALQYNDPDPVRWAAIYLLAAAVCLLYIVGRLSWYIAWVIGLIALVWAGTIAPGVWGQVSLAQMFETWKMTNPVVEEAREMCGLLIVAGWMAVLGIATFGERPTF
jgi:hypothetical protein